MRYTFGFYDTDVRQLILYHFSFAMSSSGFQSSRDIFCRMYLGFFGKQTGMLNSGL